MISNIVTTSFYAIPTVSTTKNATLIAFVDATNINKLNLRRYHIFHRFLLVVFVVVVVVLSLSFHPCLLNRLIADVSGSRNGPSNHILHQKILLHLLIV